jgi:glycerol-3-phosphate O-acyltransferase
VNVIKFLEEAELITAIIKEEKGGKKEISYALTENRAEMEVLRRRLFKLL